MLSVSLVANSLRHKPKYLASYGTAYLSGAAREKKRLFYGEMISKGIHYLLFAFAIYSHGPKSLLANAKIVLLKMRSRSTYLGGQSQCGFFKP